MNAIELLTSSLGTSRQLIEWIVSDLSDADLLVRPVPEANHFAWQLGHLLSSERNILLEQLPHVSMPELPPGFSEQHASPPPSETAGYLTRDEYLSLYGRIREATVSALATLTDADLSIPTKGSLASFFPTLGSVFSMFSDHIYMHLGQASVVRRKLGKPVLF